MSLSRTARCISLPALLVAVPAAAPGCLRRARRKVSASVEACRAVWVRMEAEAARPAAVLSANRHAILIGTQFGVQER
jgi:hypothetical protein